MTRAVGLVVLLSCLVRPATADEAALKEARRRWLAGNYAEALDKFRAQELHPKHRVAAVIGASLCLESEGEYDKALEAIEAALKDTPNVARLLGRQAELLYLRGRWDEAEKAADRAIAEQDDQFVARWARARVYRDRGQLKKADAEFRWFVRTYSERSDADKDITDPDELLLVGLAGAENARWNKLSDQFEFILKEVYGDALKADKQFWPAELQAGLLLLEKYNRAEGLAALDKALTLNPRAAGAHVGKGIAALQRLELQDAERFAEQALAINPRLPEALRLRADVHLATGEFAKALKELDAARKVNPRDEETLGRVAACLRLTRKQADHEALLKEVEKANPTPGVFHLTLAEALEGRRRFGEAEAHFKKAAALRPVLTSATTELGLLYMRMGKEPEATKLLDESFKADPFNVRVSNMRKVLRHLEKYETLKTAHFELRFDPKTDAVLAGYLGEYLEQVYEELATKFGHRPAGPILIEVFNNHEMFSGRTIALPDLHTIGACTGRMIAMVSPKGRSIRKPFNWARVIRHEIVHIFNLDQTQFLVPHWLTEGLAVQSENMDRPPTWNQLLLTRVPKGELLNLDNIDLGFMRPRSPLDWTMAYCQSELYVEYIEKTFGARAVGGLLDAYRDGLDTTGAIDKVCKVSRDTFEKGYRRYLDEVVKTIGGRPAEKAQTLNELKAAHEKNPEDNDLAARLAERYLRSERPKARKLAREVLDRKPKHPLATYVLAQLARLGGDTEEARTLLEGVVDRDNPDPKVMLALGKIYFDENEFKKAAEVLELGRKAEPYEQEWLVQLARVYSRGDDRDRLIDVLAELVKTDADDLESRKKLTRLLGQADKHAQAERYARECLEIDVTDAEARDALFRALEAQKKGAELARLRKILEK